MRNWKSMGYGLAIGWATAAFGAGLAGNDASGLRVARVAKVHPFRSDDGSLIRNLPGIAGVEAVHCRLPRAGVIQACRHRTVSQIWYVLAGRGELWLQTRDGRASLIALSPGTVATLPVGFAFQFRNRGAGDLDILIVNTSPWSGVGELIPVRGPWERRQGLDQAGLPLPSKIVTNGANGLQR